MTHRLAATLLGAAFSAALSAGDISGSYSGVSVMQTLNGERQRQVAMIVKHTPEKLIVSIGPNLAEQHPASNAKLEGDRLTFEVIPPGAESPAMKCDLRIEEDKLTGTQVMMPRNGEPRTGKLNLKKQ